MCFGEGPEGSEGRPGRREGGGQENIHQLVLLLEPSASPGQAAPGTQISSFCPQPTKVLSKDRLQAVSLTGPPWGKGHASCLLT